MANKLEINAFLKNELTKQFENMMSTVTTRVTCIVIRLSSSLRGIENFLFDFLCCVED